MTHRLRGALIAIATVAALAALVLWLNRPQPLPVLAQAAERGRVEASVSNTRAGEVEACQRTRLSTILGGRIDYLGIKEGDRVEAGQVLMRLWHQDLSARAQVAEAQLATAKSRAHEACTVAVNAEREAERQEALAARGFVSASRVESARTDAEARRAACTSAHADMATAERQLAAADIDLGRIVIVAPFAGTVAKITGELGEYSTPSPPGVPTPPAIDLIDDSCLYVKAPMDEVDAPRIRPGMTARVSVDALPGRHFEATVRRVAPFVSAQERQARTVDIDVDFASQDEARGLLVGYSADVEIVLDSRDDVLRIPSSALRGGNTVLVIGADGVLEERALQTGVANWEYTEVAAGLAEGERVVTSLEREGVRPGARAVPETTNTR
ncbi:efflux RND transporter periplasmic adaptor subunit [Pseudothauera nasutitermitis]|uniref:Efflux RND transporter periplasmic adaptor subunit n=1 Tax=Pseudothauera nasutitermitis TaxID=2565930 RepID=A0A4S4ALZ8_9RHOO|nr:efflux RND transporter periplasmic adaptor subunit [Pseudothauera nasutitermitis]THF60576.1 efflux RND transporter periplasmic adaptor subunit [Pseudothauera nasutitermitis]